MYDIKTDIDKALRLDPNYAEAYLRSGGTYFGKDNDRAIADFSEAIRLLGLKCFTAYFARGLAYSIKEDYDRAIADFSEALRLNPNAVDAYLGRSAAYGSKGELNEAIADFEAVLRIDPNHAVAKQSLELVRQAQAKSR